MNCLKRIFGRGGVGKLQQIAHVNLRSAARTVGSLGFGVARRAELGAFPSILVLRSPHLSGALADIPATPQECDGSTDRCVPPARSRARSARAWCPHAATEQRSGRQLMRAKRRTPITCRHTCWRKEPLRSDQRSVRSCGDVPWRVFRAGRDNFRDNLGQERCSRNSKPVVYLGFSPR